ncbi:DUF3987 domain-containing protein [Neorhizobium sp. P12A]|nr:DUF3987 domain-containing protein [Neorhizobium sp. P12A]
MIHGLAAGIDGLLVVAAYYADPLGNSDVPGAVSHHRVGDIDGMVEAIMAHASTPNANVFTGLQVMRKGLSRGSRGTANDIVAVLGLVVDLDADTGRAGDMPIEPNLVLETSPGNFQPFILFDRALAPAEAKPLAASLKRATGSDHGTADICHIWRVPGTRNWPNRKKIERGRSGQPVAVVIDLPWDGSCTPVGDIEAALAGWPEPIADGRAFELGEAVQIDNLTLSETAAAMLGADDVGDRSAHAARVVEQLAFEGLTAEQAFAVFSSAGGDWFRRYDVKDARSDFERSWRKFGLPHVEAREAGSEIAAAFVARHSAKESPVAANDNVPPHIAPTRIPVPPEMHPDPFTPEAAGGLLSDVARWITKTAIIPVSELSLTSALALLGGMFGDRALGPTRSGLNLFLTTVMGVASGKGHAPKSIISLASSAGKPGAVTNGDPTSYAAIERMLRKNKSTVVVMDEFGVTLQSINSKRTDAAAASIRKFLLAIYDQADSTFHGRQYASGETKKDDSPIEGPALTVLGMTTPGTFYAGLSDASLNDGFLSRFVFIEGTGPSEVIPPSLNRKSEMPSALVASLKEASAAFPTPTGFMAKKFMIPFDGGEGGDAYRLWSDVFRWQHNGAWDERQHHINGRAAENTVRLATIRAVSRNPADPVVTVDDVAWGWAIIYRSVQIVTEGVDRHMSGSAGEALRKAIVRALEGAKEQTLPWSFLLQREGVSAAEADDVSKALQWLIDTERVVSLSKQAKPGARGRFQLVAA